MTELREIDKRLAEWMGYQGIREEDGQLWYPSPISKLADGSAVMCGIPHFSEDIAAAFLVVEFVRARGYHFTLSNTDTIACATFCDSDYSTCWNGFGPQYAEAIARAAIAVMEAENKPGNGATTTVAAAKDAATE